MSLWLLNTLTKEKGKDKMKHALVVGGTGMLKDVTLWLVKLEYHVSVIGRTKNKFSRIQNEVADPKQLTFLQLDYTNTNILKEKLTSAIAKNGPIELVVAWIHSTAPNALQTITEIVSTTNPNKW
jgi:short-subunit dehydrogenase